MKKENPSVAKDRLNQIFYRFEFLVKDLGKSNHSLEKMLSDLVKAKNIFVKYANATLGRTPPDWLLNIVESDSSVFMSTRHLSVPPEKLIKPMQSYIRRTFLRPTKVYDMETERKKGEPPRQAIMSYALMEYFAGMALLAVVSEYLISCVHAKMYINYSKSLRRRALKVSKFEEELDKKQGPKSYDKWYERLIKLSDLDFDTLFGNKLKFNQELKKILKDLSPDSMSMLEELHRYVYKVAPGDLTNENRFYKSYSGLVGVWHGFNHRTSIDGAFFHHLATARNNTDLDFYKKVQPKINESWGRVNVMLAEAEKKVHDSIDKSVFLKNLTPGRDMLDVSPNFRWVLIPNSDESEAALMRHCATGPVGSKILSLREKIKYKKKTYWIPRLSFVGIPMDYFYAEHSEHEDEQEELMMDDIGFTGSPLTPEMKREYLEEQGGITNIYVLGEMKGFANSQPDKKYIPHIKELLKQGFIHGIKGGGYMPLNNFNYHDDLSEADKHEIDDARASKGLSDLLEVQRTRRAIELRGY